MVFRAYRVYGVYRVWVRGERPRWLHSGPVRPGLLSRRDSTSKLRVWDLGFSVKGLRFRVKVSSV